ncbi:MAG: hypothetical protein CMB51_07160 [Euryarchaeota archaeon]|nr:hypothetical protein [Euryarchaeota archaeon]DAC18980.1 MAG TPA: hypothetical protein D7I06_00860 [Candidatus Poseidoniales archaeon]
MVWVLALFSHLQVTLVLFLLFFMVTDKNRNMYKSKEMLRNWIVSFSVFCTINLFFGFQTLPLGTYLVLLVFILSNLRNYFELHTLSLVLFSTITFTGTYELFFCLFFGFSVNSLLIFLFTAQVLLQIELSLDEEIIAILLGLFLGIRAVGWTTQTEDILLKNWIKYLTAPLLGVLVFYFLKCVITHLSEKKVYSEQNLTPNRIIENETLPVLTNYQEE